MIITGISTKALQDTAESRQEELSKDLKERFIKDISFNMVFYCFSVLDKYFTASSGDSETSLINNFKKGWTEGTKNQISKEISQINESLRANKHGKFAQAICNYSLPSTEEVNMTYNKAIAEALGFFEDGVSGKSGKNNKKNQNKDSDEISDEIDDEVDDEV